MSTSLAVPNASAAAGDPPKDPGLKHGLSNDAAWLTQPEDDAPPRGRVRIAGAGLLAALILALAGAGGLFVWMANEPAYATVLAAPAEAAGSRLFKARLEPRRHRVIVTPVLGAEQKPQRRARELWLMRSYGEPTPLGLIDPKRTTTLPLDPTLVSDDNPPTHLFVTLEAPGGSKAGYPTGPLAAEGYLTR
jgi:anti-sigma-K factor RskA